MRSLEFPHHFKFQSDETNDRKKLESFLFIDTNKQTNKCAGLPKIMVTYMYRLQVGVKSKRKPKVTMVMENIFNNN